MNAQFAKSLNWLSFRWIFRALFKLKKSECHRKLLIQLHKRLDVTWLSFSSFQNKAYCTEGRKLSLSLYNLIPCNRLKNHWILKSIRRVSRCNHGSKVTRGASLVARTRQSSWGTCRKVIEGWSIFLIGYQGVRSCDMGQNTSGWTLWTTDKLNSSPISVFNCGLDPGPVSLNNLEKKQIGLKV